MPGRKPFVGGNWKSNGTVESTKTLCAALSSGSNAYRNKVDVVVCPIAPQLSLASRSLRNSPIRVGAQNVSASDEGAYTGEISCNMLKDSRIVWTIVGHSERRCKYGDTDEITATKIEKCQAAGLSAIFCIGESLEEREAGKTDEVNKRMLEAVISKIKDWKKVVIAYEPVWAIGTGKVASPEEAQEAHSAIRKIVSASAGAEAADGVRILYGGSVTPENCKDLIAKEDIDGFLVGGASLKPTFSDIVTACVPAQKLRQAAFRKINKITPAMRGVNVIAKVLKAPVSVSASENLTEVHVGDDTGSVTLSVRDDRSKLCEVGSFVRIQNAHVAMIRGFIRLSVDKWATLKPASDEDASDIAKVNEEHNISMIEYVLQPQS